jgi:hypothetical protein
VAIRHVFRTDLRSDDIEVALGAGESCRCIPGWNI